MARKVLHEPEYLAKHKLEVVFGTDRKSTLCNYGILVWDTMAHGAEGDTLLAQCPNKECNGIIARPEPTFEDPNPTVVFCKTCTSPVRVESLVDMKLFRNTIDFLSLYLERLFLKIGADADIYLKFHPSDIRYEAKDRNLKQLGKARGSRQAAIYVLNRIMQDTQGGGASLSKRFKAFLTA